MANPSRFTGGELLSLRPQPEELEAEVAGARRIVKPPDLTSAVQLHRPGDRIEMRVTRGGGTQVMTLELDGPRP